MYLRYPQLRLAERDRPGCCRSNASTPVPPKPRLAPEEILRRIGEMAKFPGRKTEDVLRDAERREGARRLQRVRAGPLPRRAGEADLLARVFQFEPDEALIIETDLPETRAVLERPAQRSVFQRARIRLPAVEHQRPFRQGQSSDGRFRAVIALERSRRAQLARSRRLHRRRDLRPLVRMRQRADRRRSSASKLAELRDHLPADTPVVTPEQRAEELRAAGARLPAAAAVVTADPGQPGFRAAAWRSSPAAQPGSAMRPRCSWLSSAPMSSSPAVRCSELEDAADTHNAAEQRPLPRRPGRCQAGRGHRRAGRANDRRIRQDRHPRQQCRRNPDGAAGGHPDARLELNFRPQHKVRLSLYARGWAAHDCPEIRRDRQHLVRRRHERRARAARITRRPKPRCRCSRG